MKTETSPAVGSETRRILTSAEAYCESLLWIRPIHGGSAVPLRWNDAQRYIQREKRKLVRAGKPLRFLIPKARRMGVTTQEQALSFALAATRRGVRCVTLADTKEKSSDIFGMARLFFARLPEEMRPHRASDNRRVLAFDQLESQFFIGTAGSEAFGRGDTLQRVHISEAAYCLKSRRNQNREMQELVLGITEAASHGEVTCESTAAGNSGWWFEACTAAAQGVEFSGALWSLIFVPWFVHGEYRIPLVGDDETQILDTIDEREKWLMEQHHVDLQQIKWRRATHRRLGDKAPQEYPEILEESFLASGIGYFSGAMLNARLQGTVEPTMDDGLAIWNTPDRGEGTPDDIDYRPPRTYVVGADTAEGTPEGDWSCAYVLDYETSKPVARLRGKWQPPEFARRLQALARWYNGAVLGVERNNTSGGEVLAHLYSGRHAYPNLWFKIMDDPGGKRRKVWGWKTDALTRPIMLDDLREILNEPDFECPDKLLLSECTVFEDNGDGKYEARQGFHDDCVMAMAIAVQIRKRDVPKPRITLVGRRRSAS